MILYYKGSYVDKVREYVYENTLMAEISVNGETKYVSRAELEEKTVAEIFAEANAEAEKETTVKKVEEEYKNEVNRPKSQPPEKAADKKTVTYIAKNKDTEIEFKSVKDKSVAKYDFDFEAIEQVLNGSQKTHKGFTFEVKE